MNISLDRNQRLESTKFIFKKIQIKLNIWNNQRSFKE